MAIFGIGTDIVSLARIDRSFKRHGDKFAERILSHLELEEYRQKNNKQAYLAKRFAAKEAISKALGTGMRKGIHFQQLIVTSSDLGKPQVRLEGAAEEWATRHHINGIHLTISDERDFAVAFAIAELK